MTGRTRRPCHGTTLHITCYTRPTDGPCSAYSPSTMRASSTDTQQTRTSAQATSNPEQTTCTHDHSPRQRPYDTHGTAFRQIVGHNIFSRHTRASLGHAHRQESSRATARHRQGRYLWRSVPAGRTGAMRMERQGNGPCVHARGRLGESTIVLLTTLAIPCSAKVSELRMVVRSVQSSNAVVAHLYIERGKTS